MATRVVSAAGGNWNNSATWVGGTIPGTNDDVVADATSGNLTLNVAATIQFINFTGYTGTFTTIGSSSQLTLGSAGTSTFSATMSYSFGGPNALRKGTTTHSFNMLGTTPLPNLTFTGAGTVTALSDLYITDVSVQSATVVNGNNMYINGSLSAGTFGIGGTTTYHMVGTGALNALVLGAANTPANLTINTAGTITVAAAGIGIGSGATNSNVTFSHVAGTVVNPTFRPLFNIGTSTFTFNLIAGTTWDFYGINAGLSSAVMVFGGTCLFDKFILSNVGQSTTTTSYSLDGSAITVADFALLAALGNTGGTYYIGPRNLIFPTTFGGMTITNSININGGPNEPNAFQTPNTIVRSGTPGTPVPLTVNTWNQYVSQVRFTDINCSGGNTLYGQTLTLSGTTNITQYTLPPTGGGESSYTYFS